MKRFWSAKELRGRFYSPERFNNDAPFLAEIKKRSTTQTRILDAGAGRGEKFSYNLKGCVAKMVGADLDPKVVDNPCLDFGVVTDLSQLPFPDGYFDLVFSRYVLEHIQHPKIFLTELRRVLRPDGQFVFLTPNKWHYMSLFSRLTPHRFHAFYNRLRGRLGEDTFPTVYRMNTRRTIRSLFSQAGFLEEKLYLLECNPNYLMFSTPSFLAGIAYERMVSFFAFLEDFRINIIGVFRRKELINLGKDDL
ncbi:MAG: class I SAM-dependent methyltransferase [PVC group bacterium]